MLETDTIARPYARAVFELAREDGAAAEWSAGLALLQGIIADARMRRLLGDPRATPERLLAIIEAAGGKGITPPLRNFARVLAAAGRLPCLPQIVRQFEDLLAAAEGRVEARVISAAKLKPAQQRRLAAALARRLGKKVTLAVAVDDSLIGGAIIRAGDAALDASTRGRLRALADALA